MEIIEEESRKYEITVDYYIQEFALWISHQKNWSILIVCYIVLVLAIVSNKIDHPTVKHKELQQD